MAKICLGPEYSS